MEEIYKERLSNSILYFTKIFYYLRTGRTFNISEPVGRESHYITICRELVKVFDGETKRLIINIPPRYGKTELAIHFIAWALSQYPDSSNLYISYSHSLAKKQTQTIRSIIQMKEYGDLFNVYLKGDTTAKDNFETTDGGSVYAAGAGGSITGRGAGIRGCNRFGGCIVIDDIHKPDEVTSDTIREGINEWYYNTLQSRINSINTPIIFIGQRLHEDDLASNLIKSNEYKTLIIPAIDSAGNALNPDINDLNYLRDLERHSPYVFYSQYQQDPQPAGGGIFRKDDFKLLDSEPDILSTIITADSAETDKDHNDATVFSFWGIYKVKIRDIETDTYALHWIDCVEHRIEPRFLEDAFLNFYADCLKHKVKPKFAAIEKKSTGVTLLSVLKKYPGLSLREIERNRGSGNKSNRFLVCQPYVSKGLISLPFFGKHTEMCLEHCRKITANNTHAFDDIADTMYDAIKLALIDKVLPLYREVVTDHSALAKDLMGSFNRVNRLRNEAYRR